MSTITVDKNEKKRSFFTTDQWYDSKLTVGF